MSQFCKNLEKTPNIFKEWEYTGASKHQVMLLSIITENIFFNKKHKEEILINNYNKYLLTDVLRKRYSKKFLGKFQGRCFSEHI